MYKANIVSRLVLTIACITFYASPLYADEQQVPNAGSRDSPSNDPFEGREDLVPKGKTMFNVYCSHCHGPNAFQGERPRDLRRLKLRYREEMPDVFLQTVLNGRPEKGMPPWKGILQEDELWTIFRFLRTVQK